MKKIEFWPVRLAPLALFAAAAPGQALAQACATQRPDWDGTPVSALDEALALLLSPGGLFLLAATAVALVVRSQWGGLVTVLLWTGFITLITMFDPTGLRGPAAAEGCVGPPTLFIGVAAAICVVTVLLTMPRQSGD
ncbi:hypothetical protein [uncultured Tateyamaria sp.]|uniref:hypothetical protein n=1 Tax=uncultured Tateyamaria sp. TaxID=455651 RepID=UPI00260B55CA|nr:hypothetical protein [uncultured Tateyamaria sp.]